MNKTKTREDLTRFFKSYGLPAAAVLILYIFLLCDHAGYAPAPHGTAIRAGMEYEAATEVFLNTDRETVDMLLAGGAEVVIRADDTEHRTVAADGETAAQLLRRLGVLAGPLDTVAVTVTDGCVEITAGAAPVCREVTTVPVPPVTRRIPSPNLPQGKERMVQEGTEGLRTSVTAVTFFNGKEVARKLLSVEETAGAPTVIEYGTAAEILSDTDRIAEVQKYDDGSGLLTFQSGATLKFSSVLGVTATAYTAGRGGAGFITASGTPARVGAVAVDRRVIPLGSRLYIVTNDGKYVYGLAVAEDTGVIGERVDLYYDDYDECIRFGRRKATVYILED